MKVTAEQILTSDDKYPDRLLAADSATIHNAECLALLLSDLLDHYGKRPSISSGYRTPAANKAAGGAATSSHCEGKAVDFSDPKKEFGKWLLKNTGLLASLGLHIEDPAFTPVWAHVTNRPPRSKRIVFKP